MDLFKSKPFTPGERNLFHSQIGKPLNFSTPFWSIARCSKFNVILLGGGGGYTKSGVPNRCVIARLEMRDGNFIIIPVAKLDTDTFIVQGIAVHPKYPLQSVLALDHQLSICEFDSFYPDCKKTVAPMCELFRFPNADLPMKECALNVVTFNRDGTLLACGGVEKIVKVYKYEYLSPPSRGNPPLLYRECKCTGTIENICFSENGQYLAAETGFENIFLCKIHDMRSEVQKLSYYKYRFRGIVFDGNSLIALCLDVNKMQSWLLRYDCLEGKNLQPTSYYNLGKCRAKTLTISDCSRFVATLNLDHRNQKRAFVTVHRTDSFDHVSTFDCPIAMPQGITFNRQSDHIAVAGFKSALVTKIFPQRRQCGAVCFYLLFLCVIMLLAMAYVPDQFDLALEMIENYGTKFISEIQKQTVGFAVKSEL